MRAKISLGTFILMHQVLSTDYVREIYRVFKHTNHKKINECFRHF